MHGCHQWSRPLGSSVMQFHAAMAWGWALSWVSRRLQQVIEMARVKFQLNGPAMALQRTWAAAARMAVTVCKQVIRDCNTPQVRWRRAKHAESI